MDRGLTLRDVRRIEACHPGAVVRTFFGPQAVLVSAVCYGWGDLPHMREGEEISRSLDREISIYGADCPFPISEQKEEAKGKKHGQQKAPSGGPSHEAGQHSKEGTGSDEASPSEKEGGSRPAAGARGGNPTGADGVGGEPTDRVAPGPGDCKRTTGDSPAHDGRVVAGPGLESSGCPENDLVGHDRGGGGDNTPARASGEADSPEESDTGESYGADPNATMGDPSVALVEEPEDTPALRRLRRVLERLVSLFAPGDGVETPRIHPGRLVRELVSRRVALSRCRREVASELVIIAADVSGSCSSVAADTLAAAQGLALRDARFVVVAHHNGYPLEAWGAQAARVRCLSEGVTVSEAPDAERFGVAGPVALMVAFGDCDAEDVYRHRAALHPVVWLDHHGCKRNPIPRVAERAGGLTRVIGVGGVAQADAAAALLARSDAIGHR